MVITVFEPYVDRFRRCFDDATDSHVAPERNAYNLIVHANRRWDFPSYKEKEKKKVITSNRYNLWAVRTPSSIWKEERGERLTQNCHNDAFADRRRNAVWSDAQVGAHVSFSHLTNTQSLAFVNGHRVVLVASSSCQKGNRRHQVSLVVCSRDQYKKITFAVLIEVQVTTVFAFPRNSRRWMSPRPARHFERLVLADPHFTRRLTIDYVRRFRHVQMDHLFQSIDWKK